MTQKVRIEELRREQARISKRASELAAAEAEGALTEEQLSEFTELNAQFDELGKKIERAKQAEKMAASLATPIDSLGIGGGKHAIHVKKAPEDYKGAKIARLGMAIAAGGGDLNISRQFAEKEIGDKNVALAVSTAAGSGAALVPEDWQNEVIELLRPESVVRASGARQVPLPNGNATFPRLAGGATSSYKGESQPSKASNPRTDDVKLSAKTQTSIVPISNELIGYAGYNTEQLFLTDMISATAEQQDIKFMRGDGSGSDPKGMRPTALEAGRQIAFKGDLSQQNIEQYLGGLILALEESKSKMRKNGWLLAPRTARFLADLTNDKGNKVFPEMENGFLKGIPFKKTTNIPANLGTGGNQSEIYLADFSDVLIGDTGVWEISFSKEATYHDANGNLQSAFSNNESVLRLVTANDIGFRHLEGLVIGTDVTFNSTHYL